MNPLLLAAPLRPTLSERMCNHKGGTDPKHINDLIADGQIFNGMDEYLSGRFRGAEKAYRAAKKYGKPKP